MKKVIHTNKSIPIEVKSCGLATGQRVSPKRLQQQE